MAMLDISFAMDGMSQMAHTCSCNVECVCVCVCLCVFVDGVVLCSIIKCIMV